LTPKILAKQIALLALTKKAGDVTIMDLRKVTDMADFFVVCAGDSDTQVKAIADAVTDGMDLAGVGVWHREGLTERQWVLLDYVDVVVHVFHKEARKFYGLEKLWGDAKIEVVADEPVKPAPVTAAPAKAKAKAKAAKPKAVKPKAVKPKAAKPKAAKAPAAKKKPAAKPKAPKAK
jgi:ribosome-associated protein